jgi:hypothetical protein
MIVIESWKGLVTNVGPYAIPPGAAATQVNIQALVPGSVVVRSGITNVSFATHTGASSPVVQVFNFQHGTTGHVVYQNASGGIFVAQGPS